MMKLSSRLRLDAAVCCGLLLLPLGAAAQPPLETRPPDGFNFGLPKAADPDAGATVVVFNESDPESALLAKFYADKRGIPANQLVGLKCTSAEEISRADYDSTIAEPLRRAFTVNFWWKLRDPESPYGPVDSNRMRYLAVMRGVPVKIAPAPGYPGDRPTDSSPVGKRNEAAVDSELAALGLQMKVISGAINNPIYKGLTPIRDARRPEIMLVCRLDGPSAAVVRRMIVDGLATEQVGLRGFAYIDARGLTDPGLKEGDEWLLAAANDARKHGFPAILDNGPAMFPEGYPMRYAAIYFGWYSEQLAGPFARPGFRFPPGAVAVHIHSFSAQTVRSSVSHWVGPLLNLGAAATLGNVYEPYLSLTPHLALFFERLRLGFNFAEAAYMSQRVLSWQTTCIGDPLYRPFPAVPELAGTKETAEWDAYRKGALEWFENESAGRKSLQESARRLKSGIIWEGLGLLQLGGNQRDTAIESFAQARQAYTVPEDILRSIIHQIIQLRAAARETEAVVLARKAATTYPTAPAIGVLRMLIPAAFGAR